MEFHDVAALFPLMNTEEFHGLVADIKANGLREAIWLYEGKILDGRNRYRACLEAGVAPRYRTYTGDEPTSFVLSLNLHRRHLTYDQRVGLALKIQPLIAAELERVRRQKISAARRGEMGPKSAPSQKAATEAAQKTGVGKTAVKEMAAVQQHTPSIADDLLAQRTLVRDERKRLSREKRIAKTLAVSAGNRPLDGGLGRFPLLYADPPWRYEHTKSDNRRIENQYPTLSLEEICALPIHEVTTDNCILYLWTPNPILEQAFQVLAAWGFRYRTAMVWVKDKWGAGVWARQQHESLLVAIKGTPTAPEDAMRPSSVIYAPRRGHSEKPEEVYAMLERMYPELPKLELFARTPRPGWSAWGNQVPCGASLDELEALEAAA